MLLKILKIKTIYFIMISTLSMRFLFSQENTDNVYGQIYVDPGQKIFNALKKTTNFSSRQLIRAILTLKADRNLKNGLISVIYLQAKK